MDYSKMRKAQLIEEIKALQAKIAELERAQAERQRVEEALQESKRRYRLLAEHVTDVIWTMDMDLRFTYISPSVTGMLGYDVDEAMALTLEEILTPASLEVAMKALEEALAAVEPKDLLELELNCKEGATIWTEVKMAFLRDGDGRPVGILGVSRDITERKRAEKNLRRAHDELEIQVQERTTELTKANEALKAEISERKRAEEELRESEEKYRDLFENARDVIVAFDLKGNVTSINKAVTEYGFKEDELVGKNMLQFVSKKYWPRLLKELAKIARGNPVEGEIELTTPKGEKIAEYRSNPIRRGKKVVGLQTILRDTTERKRAEEALQTSENRLAMAVAATGLGIYEHHVPLGKECYHSERWAEILGYEVDELPVPEERLEWVLEQIHPDDRPTLEKAYTDFIEGRIPKYEVEIRIKHKSGKWIYVSGVSGAMQRDEDGQVTHLVGVMQDITERKRAEEALRESEERYRSLFEGAEDHIFVLDQDFRYVVVNPSALKAGGFTLEDVVGKGPHELFPEDAEFYLLQYRQAFETGKPIWFERELRLPDGAHWFSVTLSPIKDAQGRVIALTGISRDITERKRAEEALRASEARYRAVVESQTELIDRWLPDGTHTFVNDAYCRYYGKPREELMGQKWITHVAEEDQERAKAYIEHLITSLNPANPTAIDEHREIAADGSIRWQQWIDQALFDEQGHLVEFQSVGRDITAHRQAEEALRASERRFRALTENSADGIALLDATGAIRYESPINAQALGYSVGELVGTNVFDLVHPDDIQGVSLLLSTLVEKPETPLTIQFRFRHQDGSWCWLEATGNNLLAEPAVQAIVVNYRDITERQRAEEALRLRMEQLTALSRASQVVTASLELDRVLAEIVSLAGEVVGSGYVSVVLMDEAGHMSQSAENLPGVPAIEYRIRGEGFTSWIVRSHQAVVVDEIGEDGAVSPDPGEGAPHTANPILVEAGIRSFVGLPLIAKAHLLGVLYLHSLRPGAFHGQLSLLTAFANQAATAIENARLYKAVQQELADRKRAEEALRESEERYRLLFERNLAGVYTTTLDGDILDCNEAFAQIFGYDSREQLLADEARELFDAADREEFTAQLRQEGALLGREWLLRRTDGSPVWVLENSNLIEGEEGRLAFVQGTLIDVTERKQAEEALRESEERFRAIAEATPIPVVITRASDSMILYANEEYGKALGVPIRELLGRRSVDYYGDADERRIILDKLSKDGRLEGYELQGKRGDGTPFWTVVSALLLTFDGEQAIFTAFQDITERKRAEERIKFLAEVLDTSPLSVIATDKGAKIIYVNPATERLFGYTSDELLGKNPIILNADPNADKIQRDIFDTIGQGRVWRGEILNRKKNGEVFPIYASVYQLLDEEVNFIAVVGFQEDITERKRAEEALIRLSNAVKMSTDSIVISDLETIIIDVNEATLKMYGTDDRRDLIGRSSLDLIAPEDRERAFAGMQQALGKGYVKSREYCIITKDGSRIPVEVSAALLKDAAGEPIGFVGVSRDITERVRAERLLQALDHAAVAMGKALTPEEIFTTVAEELKKLGFSCTVLLTDESQKRLLPKYFRYEAGAIKTAEKLVSLKAEDFFIPVEAVDVYRKVIRERRAVFVEDVEGVVRQLLPGPAKRFAGQIAKMLEVSKSIAAPLIVEDEIIGLLSVQSGGLTKDDIPAIIAFAHQMAAAWRKAGLLQDLERGLIERERTQKELRQSHAKLQRALEGTVHTLVATIELKDPYTGRHQRQVAQLACAMAEEMGLPQEQIEGLRMAGLIHDLGKITVPAEILSKPGRLNDLEYGLIRMHPQTGYDVLKDMDFPWLVADIVLQHHERLDGSGYPQGLSGDEIMLEARILAVADVVAAMASHRPYRSARGLDEALEEISQNRGVLYDPEVVDVCLTLFTEKRFTFE